jgi:hypothetical protein
VRIATVVFLLLASVSAGDAQTPRIDRIDIIVSGTYVAEVTQKVDVPGTAVGSRNTVRAITFTKSTTQVSAKRGIRFGFRYKIVGAPSGQIVALKGVTRFPPQGLRNPDKHTTTYREEYPLRVKIGDVALDGYALTDAWEVVPGRWTFEIWYGSRKLAAKTFTLSKP